MRGNGGISSNGSHNEGVMDAVMMRGGVLHVDAVMEEEGIMYRFQRGLPGV